MGFGVIGKFFKNVGHLLGHTFGWLSHNISEEWLQKAIAFAEQAALQYVDSAIDHQVINAQRRAFVIVELQKLPGMSESKARLLVELAVQHLKDAAAKEIAAAGTAVSAKIGA